MRQDQIDRLTALHDRLLEVALADADPANWIAGDKRPKDMTRDERGDAKWCRSLAISTVSLTMQVQRLMQNPIVGGAAVPDAPPAAPALPAPAEEEGDPVEAEIQRYEQAATELIARHQRASNAKP